jgi:hypothetical protein
MHFYSFLLFFYCLWIFIVFLGKLQGEAAGGWSEFVLLTLVPYGNQIRGGGDGLEMTEYKYPLPCAPHDESCKLRYGYGFLS